MRRFPKALIVFIITAVLGASMGVAIAATYTNGSPGQLVMKAGDTVHATCPNHLTVGNQTATAADLQCALATTTTTAAPTTTVAPTTTTVAPTTTTQPPQTTTTTAPATTTTTAPSTVSNVIPAGPSGPSGAWGSPIFADAFQNPTGSIDRNLWGYGTTYSGNTSTLTPGNNSWESELYSDTGANVTESPSGLTLTASPQTNTFNGTTYSYLSGGLNTLPPDPNNVGWTAQKGFTVNPSQATFAFEASLQVDPTFDHAWPAFWLTPTSNVWPPEFDINEFLTGTSDQEIPESHVIYGPGGVNQLPFYGTKGTQYSTSFHTYTGVFGPGGVFFYVDGQQIGSVTDPTVLSQVLNENFYLLLNQAVTGDPGNTMNLRARYVAVWEQGTGGYTGGGIGAGT